MPLFPEFDPASHSLLPSPESLGFAETFKDIIASNCKVHGKFSIKAWSVHFSRMLLLDQIPSTRILQVLTWYGANLGKAYVPQAYSPGAFRRKFLAIEAAMHRQLGSDVNIPVLAEDQRIHAKLKLLAWPTQTQPFLLSVIALSRRNYERHSEKRNKVLQSAGKAKEIALVRFLEKMTFYFGTVPTFIKDWMVGVQKIIGNWKAWNGELKSYAFQENHKLFEKKGISFSVAHSGSDKSWREFMKRMREV